MLSLANSGGENDKRLLMVKGKWTGRDIHDTKFNEDKLSIQFRTGRLGRRYTTQ